MKEIRKLKANEIDCRVSQVSEKGLRLLLYKDARADMKVLDETFGAMNWKRSHQLIGDRLYCTVEVYDMDKKEWVAKQDVGTESNTEAEKGQASDSFKRACTNFGLSGLQQTKPQSRKAKLESQRVTTSSPWRTSLTTRTEIYQSSKS